LPYDVASLLYDGKADIPHAVRQELLAYYVENWQIPRRGVPNCFINIIMRSYWFVSCRQWVRTDTEVFYERKEHFLLSIPYALKNLAWILESVTLPIKLPTLWKVFEKLIHSEALHSIKQPKLHVDIQSFSYKKGYPRNTGENGGGFVFDCRCLPNPGRLEAYACLSGLDEEVIQYLAKEKEVILFFEHITSVIDIAVQNYLQRDFSHLAIAFGCTGGQHRSVYFTEN